MAKLYFKYGAMGSSKTAQALITKFNYEERGMKVWLIKPSKETRDGELLLKSRIGLTSVATPIYDTDNIYEIFKAHHTRSDVIIADECQFFNRNHIDEMRKIVDEMGIPVLCFGLRTDFRTELFEGSKRLFELADSIAEIKTICACGRKATVNARIDNRGKITTEGEQLCLGGDDKYIALCHKCYAEKIKNKKSLCS